MNSSKNIGHLNYTSTDVRNSSHKQPSDTLRLALSRVTSRNSNESRGQRRTLKSKQDSSRLAYLQIMNKKGYTFYVGNGNNEQVIRKVMSIRENDWNQTKQNSTMFVNFRWQQGQRGYKYQRLMENKSYKAVVNHFQNHSCFTNKEELFRNLDAYCMKNKINIHDFVPPTFILNANDECCGSILSTFLETYAAHSQQLQKLSEEDLKKYLCEAKRKLKYYFYSNNQKKVFSKVSIDKDVFVSRKKNCYMWILKPAFMNRGRGIQVFGDIPTLQRIVAENVEGYVEKSFEPGVNTSDSPRRQSARQLSILKPIGRRMDQLKTARNKSLMGTETKDPNIYSRNQLGTPFIIKTNAFIIQKYLQNPFLINQRKFDFRVWVLVTHEMDAYFFKQGYIRLSSQKYQLSSQNISNQFIHLTNNAVQKHSTNYNSFCEGNQLSFDWLKTYLKKLNINTNFQTIIDKMKDIIKVSLKAIEKKIDPFNRKFCFEIFGYDFILDKNLKPWLIEVNTNPCIEQSSPLLSSLVPRMIDDAFRLTLDVLFPLSKKLGPSPFRVPKYESNHNMWEHLLKLQRKKG